MFKMYNLFLLQLFCYMSQTRYQLNWYFVTYIVGFCYMPMLKVLHYFLYMSQKNSRIWKKRYKTDVTYAEKICYTRNVFVTLIGRAGLIHLSDLTALGGGSRLAFYCRQTPSVCHQIIRV